MKYFYLPSIIIHSIDNLEDVKKKSKIIILHFLLDILDTPSLGRLGPLVTAWQGLGV